METPPTWSTLGPPLALMLAALNIINIIYTWWRTRDQNVETRFKAGSERMDRADARLASVEQTLRTLPSKEDLHQLQMSLGDVRGEIREMRAIMTATSDAFRRHDAVLTRVEQYLLQNSGK